MFAFYDDVISVLRFFLTYLQWNSFGPFILQLSQANTWILQGHGFRQIVKIVAATKYVTILMEESITKCGDETLMT